MKRCLELAQNGAGFVAPNPLVGSVVMARGQIIGEGYHRNYGGPHAEVNAIGNVADRSLLNESTIYVNLEPCAHHGKTPPCSDLIIASGIPRVVIGCRDPFHEVDGKGIEQLKKAGVEVVSGVLEEEAKALNQRFFTYHLQKRPFILLKWAQTSDGFLDHQRAAGSDQAPLRITGAAANRLVHRWRSEEAGILIGSNTALLDQPQLDVRHYSGPNPVRILVDRQGRVPSSHSFFRPEGQGIVFTSSNVPLPENIQSISISTKAGLSEVLKGLYDHKITSVLVEGGARILNAFLAEGLWDEARVFTSLQTIGKGVKAPSMLAPQLEQQSIDQDTLTVFKRL